MITYSSPVGPVLKNVKVKSWRLMPSAEQKATATIKYDNLVPIKINGTVPLQKVDNYEAGKISFAEINDLTRDYVENLKSGLVQ
jgi:hypothetical protein